MTEQKVPYVDKLFTSLQLQASFDRDPQTEGFLVTCKDRSWANPPGILARIALHQIKRDTSVIFPTGYTADSLEELVWEIRPYCAPYETPTPLQLSGTQGIEFAFIGRQLFGLNEEHKLEPPLTPRMVQQIGRLVEVVADVYPDYMKIALDAVQNPPNSTN